MDYAPADYEMGEVEEDMYFAGRIMGDTESEDEDEHDHLVSLIKLINFHCFAWWLCYLRYELT